MNRVTSDESFELVPWSDSLFAGLYTHMYYIYISWLSFERSYFQEFYIRTEFYYGLEERHYQTLLPSVVLFHVA